mgnify:CR=1 FL=1
MLHIPLFIQIKIDDKLALGGVLKGAGITPFPSSLNINQDDQ